MTETFNHMLGVPDLVPDLILKLNKGAVSVLDASAKLSPDVVE